MPEASFPSQQAKFDAWLRSMMQCMLVRDIRCISSLKARDPILGESICVLMAADCLSGVVGCIILKLFLANKIERQSRVWFRWGVSGFFCGSVEGPFPYGL